MKLNYDRDVKALCREVEDLTGKELKIHNPSTKWNLYIDGKEVYEGTLREVYCILVGMKLQAKKDED